MNILNLLKILLQKQKPCAIILYTIDYIFKGWLLWLLEGARTKLWEENST